MINPYRSPRRRKVKMIMTNSNRKKKEFSKVLLIQESILVWITTLALLVLSFLSVEHDYIGELSWLPAMVTTLWGAYGISQAFYYNKSKAENTVGGVTYALATSDLPIINNSDEEASG